MCGDRLDQSDVFGFYAPVSQNSRLSVRVDSGAEFLEKPKCARTRVGLRSCLILLKHCRGW